jgi:hypothetical protein
LAKTETFAGRFQLLRVAMISRTQAATGSASTTSSIEALRLVL